MVQCRGTTGTLKGYNWYTELGIMFCIMCSSQFVSGVSISSLANYILVPLVGAMEEDASSIATGISRDRPSKRVKTAVGNADQPPPMPDDANLPSNYKCKRCRYCRQWSLDRSPWNCQGTSLAQWHPCIPWHRGSLQKPSGDLCKACAIAACQLW